MNSGKRLLTANGAKIERENRKVGAERCKIEAKEDHFELSAEFKYACQLRWRRLHADGKQESESSQSIWVGLRADISDDIIHYGAKQNAEY